MKGMFPRSVVTAVLFCASLGLMNKGAQAQSAASSDRQPPALTIYNGNFALVRGYIPLELTSGVNALSFTEVTSHLEPDSVILRDPSEQRSLQVLEQNYRADPVSQELLLSLYEGKTIDFLVQRGEHQETIKGKIIRSGYVPSMVRYGQYQQPAYSQPIIEVDGVLRFGLPGQPLFPALTGDTILNRHSTGSSHRQARHARRRARLHHQRHDLGSFLQPGGAGERRHHGPGRLGDDDQHQWTQLRECAHQAAGRRCEQAPGSDRFAMTGGQIGGARDEMPPRRQKNL